MAKKYSGRLVSPADLKPFRTESRAFKPFIRRTTPDIVTERVRPEVAIDKPCQRKPGKSGKKELRACHVELAFIGDAMGASKRLKPGAYLRACSAFGKEGVLIPVNGYKDALAKSAAYCACLGGENKKAAACARSIGSRGQLGRARRR